VKIRFSIIGFGNIGRRHAGHIMQNPATELVAVCDTNEALQSEAPVGVPFFHNYYDMLHAVESDVVCVCTPNYVHEAHAVSALRAGRHVVVEKPMAISLLQCDRMIQASKQYKKIIFAVKQNRYNPPVQEAKKLIENGSLGKIYMFEVNCFWNRNEAYYKGSDWRGTRVKDGGCLFTQFSHFVDIMYYLNGKIKKVHGELRNFAHGHITQVEDSGSFIMEGENESLITFNFSTCAFERNMEGSIGIIAEKGALKIGGQYLNTLDYHHVLNVPPPQIAHTGMPNDYGSYQGSMSNHDKVIQNVVDVLNNGHAVMASAEEGRDVVQIIEQMYAGVRK
jgi:UDP-N-acetyl-2-amino-2-deoxyglucuronate dehydrogenase